VIIATGVTDILPSTPGVVDAFGKGMYWCPWCDGYEHREQSLAVVGPLSNALSAILEIYTLNQDIIVMTNGTDTPEERAALSKKSTNWEEQFKAYNISIVNTTISSIKRLKDENGRTVSIGNFPSDTKLQHQISADKEVKVMDDNSGPNGKHKDLFLVKFADGLSVERAAFIIYIPTKQTSRLADQLKLNMTGSKIKVDAKMETSHAGIFAVGDANDDGSTNVPHAMYSGKRAAVVAHSKLSLALLLLS
jgi:thioredoxin reductase